MTAADLLAASRRFSLSPGLSEAELGDIEDEFAFHFAAEHRAFLAAVVPTGRKWPDWRGDDREKLRELFAWPVQGVIYDVDVNGFWYEGWGRRPDETGDAVAMARRYLATVPRMVPLYSHRFLPAGVENHPVLSMMRTDIITYGNDLTDWVDREFGLGEAQQQDRRVTVPFWRDLVV